MVIRAHRPLWRSAVAACLVCTLLQARAALAGGPSTEVSAETATTLQQRGLEFERAQKWPEAVELYEQGVKSWPDAEPMKKGLRRTKIQFTIDRRYSDRSFTERLLPLSRYEAIVYLDEVLTKVRQHYVDDVSTWSLVAHGTESLYLGLSNQRFVQRNIPNASPERVTALRKTLVSQYWNKRVNGIDGARTAVLEVAALCEREVGLSPTATVLEYVFGGCHALDDYSSYLTPGRLDDLYNNIEGEFVGIGIEMKAETGKGLLLVNVLPESPASEGGVRSGDYIVSIDGVNCRHMTTEEAAGLLQGTPESRVRLGLTSGDSDDERSAQLTRRAVKVKSIPTVEMVDSASGIGYIRMTGFQKNTADELDVALLQLNRQGMQALIWDVRGNPGGLLTAAVEVLDRFIDNGVLVSTKGRTPEQNLSYSAQQPGTWRGPLVLLIDGDSASASEIVAGAVRDHHRGVIVGRKSYGKWSVQSILPCRDNTGLRLTTAKFYSPADRTYDREGVPPDVTVEQNGSLRSAHRGGNEKESLSDDRDIKTGIELLHKQLARR